MGRKAVDDLRIITVYNRAGCNEAKELLNTGYQIKYPRDLIARLKQTPNYRYNKEQDFHF